MAGRFALLPKALILDFGFLPSSLPTVELKRNLMKQTGINIFSGADDWLGAALTNPTGLAVRKGTLAKGYPVLFSGKRFHDAETAYHALAGSAPAQRDTLMAELICAKFSQHPALLTEVLARGGRDFLAACSHWTGGKSDGAKAWEGKGEDSRFIRNLLRGFDLYQDGALTEEG